MSVTTQIMTAEEFFDWAILSENAGHHYELQRGVVVEMPLPGERHGVVCGNVTFILGTYVRQRKQGRVLSNDSGILLERDPDTLRGPDVIFFLESRPYEELNPKFVEDLPTLVVEVISPNDHYSRITQRVREFIKAAIPLIWLVDPEIQEITVHRPGQEAYVLIATDEITGEDVLPDFRCPVADFFFSP